MQLHWFKGGRCKIRSGKFFWGSKLRKRPCPPHLFLQVDYRINIQNSLKVFGVWRNLVIHVRKNSSRFIIESEYNTQKWTPNRQRGRNGQEKREMNVKYTWLSEIFYMHNTESLNKKTLSTESFHKISF